VGARSATAADVGWAALAFIGGTLLTEVPRIAKRWWLMTANARIRANVRADAFRGVLAWPMADVQRTPVGDLMARIVGDVEVLGVGRTRVHDRDLGHRAVLALVRRRDARLRSGPHRAGAACRAVRDGGSPTPPAAGSRGDHEGARSER